MPVLKTADGAEIKQGEKVWGLGGMGIKSLVRGVPSESGVAPYEVTEASNDPVLIRDSAGIIWRADPSLLYSSRWLAALHFLNQCVDTANTTMKSFLWR